MFGRNVRFLLWKERPENRAVWPQILAGWAGVSEARSQGLLVGTTLPSSEELTRVADALGVPDEELSAADLLEGVDILGHNIRFLLASLPHGAQQELGKKLGVHKTTISRWGRKHHPTRERLALLAEHFGLRTSELVHEPIFLSLGPVSSLQKREWVRDRVSALSENELQALYPALERMLDGK